MDMTALMDNEGALYHGLMASVFHSSTEQLQNAITCIFVIRGC